MKDLLFTVSIMLLISTLAIAKNEPPIQTTISEDTAPKTERYCDPAVNAQVLTTIKATHDQLKASEERDPNRINLLIKIDRLNRKLKCVTRPIQIQE